MRLMNAETVVKLSEVVTKDQFNDQYQNENTYGGEVSGEDILMGLFMRNVNGETPTLDIGCGSGELFEKLPITDAVEPNEERLKRAIEAGKRDNIQVRHAVAESLPYTDGTFSNVVCWGTFCFLRSLPEAMVEINRVLKVGGVLLCDLVIYTTLPIAQTMHPVSGVNYLRCFGFSLIERRRFGNTYHRRLALAMEKTGHFAYQNLLVPQCEGKINNRLARRDWYIG